MDEERERILQMVEAGKITADEAGALLSALEGTPDDELPAATETPRQAHEPPERPWEFPFFGGLIVAALGLLGLGRAVRSGRRRSLPARAGAWLTILAGAAAVAIGFWSRSAPWLHVRLFSSEGDNMNFSIPLPLFLADWFIDLASTFADEDAAAQLQSVAAFVHALRSGDAAQPFAMEVEEGDGNRLLVQIG